MIEWMKEILGDAYTEDIDNKITARLTADYAPKADLEAANTAKSEAEAALAAANDKYKDVDIDALRADAEKYKAEAAQARKDADERVAAVQFDGKLDAAITAAHGRSAKAIRALLDVDTLKGSDKQDEAITAALAALQKTAATCLRAAKPRRPTPPEPAAPRCTGPTPTPRCGRPWACPSTTDRRNALWQMQSNWQKAMCPSWTRCTSSPR